MISQNVSRLTTLPCYLTHSWKIAYKGGISISTKDQGLSQKGAIDTKASEVTEGSRD